MGAATREDFIKVMLRCGVHNIEQILKDVEDLTKH